MLEEQHKKIEANNQKFNLFNKREMKKTTKHLNNETDEAAEEFYKMNKKKTIAYHFKLSFLNTINLPYLFYVS